MMVPASFGHPGTAGQPGHLQSGQKRTVAGLTRVYSLLSHVNEKHEIVDLNFDMLHTYMLHVIEKHEDVCLHFFLMFLVYMRFKQRDLICEPQWRGFQTLREACGQF